MIDRLSDSLLLRPCDIQPSQPDWEPIGVFNPAVAIAQAKVVCGIGSVESGVDAQQTVAATDDSLVMLARVAERPIEQRPDWKGLPRWTRTGDVAVDWFRDRDIQNTDARVVKLKSSGELRLTSVSHFQVLRRAIVGNEAWTYVRSIYPEGCLEEYGIEDPRVTRIDDTYWITYVAVSRSGAATALMSTTDFVNFQRHGIIFASENKDVVLFPERIDGRFFALHRPNPRSHFCPPQIWIASSPDLIHWGGHKPIFSGRQRWEGDRVGSGTPPVRTNDGWLTLYHGSEPAGSAGTVGRYAAGAFLLRCDDPTRVIARSNDPIMLPTTNYETHGFVPNVVFPTAMLDVGDQWHVYYGAADTSVAMTRFSKRSVSDSLVSKGDAQ